MKPDNFATTAQPKNFEKKAMTQMRIVYHNVMPLSNKPRFVLRPEKTKYYKAIRMVVCNRGGILTKGRKSNETRSSSFSTREIAKPLS